MFEERYITLTVTPEMRKAFNEASVTLLEYNTEFLATRMIELYPVAVGTFQIMKNDASEARYDYMKLSEAVRHYFQSEQAVKALMYYKQQVRANTW